jgi:hypothetical protein
MTHEERREEIGRLAKAQADEHSAWDEWWEADKEGFAGIIGRARVAMLADMLVRAASRKEECRERLRAEIFPRKVNRNPFADIEYRLSYDD